MSSSPRVPDRIVIVGASAGGLATAEALRMQGYRGTITLIGDESHLPYDRPPLSKQFLGGEWEPERLMLRSAAQIDALGLDLRLAPRPRAWTSRRRPLRCRTAPPRATPPWSSPPASAHDDLAGIVSVGFPPKTLRTWRAAIANRQEWPAAVSGTLAA